MLWDVPQEHFYDFHENKDTFINPIGVNILTKQILDQRTRDQLTKQNSNQTPQLIHNNISCRPTNVSQSKIKRLLPTL